LGHSTENPDTHLKDQGKWFGHPFHRKVQARQASKLRWMMGVQVLARVLASWQDFNRKKE